MIPGWLADPRTWAAAVPACLFIGSAAAYYFGTETGDDMPVPLVRLGDAEHEPWGVPYPTRRYRLPGSAVQRTNRVIEHDTALLPCISDN